MKPGTKISRKTKPKKDPRTKRPVVLALITARGGSKGLPRKNVLPLRGLPLIAWSIAAAKASRAVDRVVCSTEDREIAEVARQHGAEVPFLRPRALAGDRAAHAPVVVHALGWLERHEGYRPDYLLLLQPTSPLRTGEDIDAAVGLAVRTRADAVVGVAESGKVHHPFLAFALGRGGRLAPFVKGADPERRRQEMPRAFALNGAIFLNRREAFLRDRTFLPRRSVGYVMPEERSLEIDTAWDFRLIDFVMREKGIGVR